MDEIGVFCSTHTLTHPHADAHTHEGTYAHHTRHTRKHRHTQTQTQTQTHTHTHTHTHIHTCSFEHRTTQVFNHTRVDKRNAHIHKWKTWWLGSLLFPQGNNAKFLGAVNFSPGNGVTHSQCYFARKNTLPGFLFPCSIFKKNSH